ncbi:hypothetical protein ACFY1L_23000 [Streptomyces sp. NPDC001663]|uniref:hypothetical protein n=1 Tax=Streptomyces sp. NPDC001663 TaxID=3364597 RepID=UPI0036BFB0BD
MERQLVSVWWVGFALAVVVLGVVWAVAGYGGGVVAVVFLAGLVSGVGVVPARVLALRWVGRLGRRSRAPEWVVHLGAAVVWSCLLSLLSSAVLIGLPHGWDTATSPDDVLLRTVRIVDVLVPVALGTHLVIRLRGRRRAAH